MHEAADSTDTQKEGILLVPLLYYTPDTRFAAGAMGVYYFHTGSEENETRLSFVKLLADYTQNKQVDVWSSWNIFTEGEKYLFKGELRYRNFPDRFFGVGNNTTRDQEEFFSYDLLSLKFLAMQQVRRHLFLGLDFNFEKHYNITYGKDGALKAGEVTGSGGGIMSGFGFVGTWDTRDNVINAHKGFLLEFASYFNRDFFGSTFDYNLINFEFNKFVKVSENSVLAFNTVGVFTQGEVPFLSMPRLGSDKILRGYPAYRFRDQNFLATQVEYRFPVYWRFGLVTFAGIGDVFDNRSDLSLDLLKYSYGFGLRYLANESERLNLRIDFGFGRNSSAFYILLTESF
ncbi:MAG: BamA/TamA family outer membrane protein [Luteibaculaceae bacterium]